MAADKAPAKKAVQGEGAKVVKGPWEAPPAKPARIPAFKRRGAAGAPIINNWAGLLVVVLLIFVAPPLIGWISQLILGAMRGGS
jgi:hypothetical protein